MLHRQAGAVGEGMGGQEEATAEKAHTTVRYYHSTGKITAQDTYVSFLPPSSSITVISHSLSVGWGQARPGRTTSLIHTNVQLWGNKR